MKVLSKLFALIIAVAFFASCSDSNNPLDDGNNNSNQIRLSSSVSLLKSNLQNTQIVNGEEVGFRVVDHTLLTTLYPNVKLTADGAGKFTYGTTMYYPTNGNTVDFYAYHPYSSGLAQTDSLVSFSTKTAQDIQANYLLSDLLHSSKSAVVRTNAEVPMTFKHKLSKLSFTVTKGDGADISGLDTIQVLNVLPDVKLNLLAGTLSAATGTATTVTAFDVHGGTADSTSLTGSSAIVVPQTIAANTAFLLISIGGVHYTYTPTADLTLLSGKNYRFNITVNMATIKIESTIEDWDSSPEVIDGTGTID